MLIEHTTKGARLDVTKGRHFLNNCLSDGKKVEVVIRGVIEADLAEHWNDGDSVDYFINIRTTSLDVDTTKRQNKKAYK